MPPWYEVSHPEIEALRAALAAPVPGSFLGQVVLLTSAESEEGTCSLAALLAASLARSGRRTLLIDAHLQTPLLHRTFQLPADPGLSEVLRGQVALAKAVRGLPLDRLWLLPAGQELPRALEKFEREEALTFLNQARKDYEYVLINGGPVLPNAEVLLLARRADEIFLAVRLGHSRFPNVHAAWQRLGIVEGLRGVVAV
jgi:Mrp family chromosome partitioning ATPase